MSFLPIDSVMSQALRAAKIRGPRPAIVVDNKNSEGNPGYRVKLVFPWLHEQQTTFWARIAVAMAGAGRGTYMLPEIDDQVLVVFEHGDIDRPIVIGALWSKKQEPVEVHQSGTNNTKLIKSRCGHRIIFDDKEGAESITIVDRTRRNKIVLDSFNKCLRIESDGDIEVIAKSNVIVHANAVKIGASESMAAKAASLLTHAAKTFSLKAFGSIAISGGTTTINVSHAAATRVSGSGAGELGGAGSEPARDLLEQSRGRPAIAHVSRPSRASGRNEPANDGAGADTPMVVADRTFIELRLIDSDGSPVGFASYKVTAADGAMFSGALDADGHVRIDGIVKGNCEVTFPGFPADDWSAA